MASSTFYAHLDSEADAVRFNVDAVSHDHHSGPFTVLAIRGWEPGPELTIDFKVFAKGRHPKALLDALADAVAQAQRDLARGGDADV